MPLRRHLLVIALLLATVPAAALETFKTSELTVVSASGPHKFTVELALNGAQMEQGLMFRHSLAPDAGMLFDFGAPINVTMWMKNTFIPLDMIFIRADGSILRIAENTEPLSDRLIPSGGPVRAVLEVIGGTARKLGIAPGDKVAGSVFKNSP